ncbi:sigma-70 family RNA polymerase sigma factor [Lysobacter solisilvae (ex Woo and Kim 2020)]|uniref:RNA polymerase sigma factor n=1 Tax=Agrilutibacter terrestris TaxID=2865112 RepID=A0A7H0G0D7_9GAMM|nr:sigma-70 family RNA polymerase sigma factor [Lysobacter terrestris]QNP41753.1 sigma-70 family RNA polymerase sigma factor [Lysobacter terrestris]
MDDTAVHAIEEADLVAALLRDVARGDRSAFEALYRTTSSTLLGVCMRVLADRSEAEEVLQEVYVSVWSKAAQFDAQRARAMAWLGSIARHRAIDRLRHLPAPALRAPVELVELAADASPGPAALAEVVTDRVQLDDCMRQLDARRQSLIRTAFFEGVSYDELARRSGSPLGSVKSWIRRGLLQLRACLER